MFCDDGRLKKFCAQTLRLHRQICDVHLTAVGKVRKSFKCPFAPCDKEFPLSAHLNQHITRHHKKFETLWPCRHAMCHKFFGASSVVKKHSNIKHVRATYEQRDRIPFTN